MSTTATYSAHTFADGDTFTAAQANVLDAGVYDTHYANAGAHNSIWRGKSLGTSLSSTVMGYISAGTFTDLFLGDYWTLSSAVYRIQGFDYCYNCGDTAFTTHHAVVVPDSNMYSAPMNSTNITTGAYVGSAMYTGEDCTVSSATYTGLTNANSTISSLFGSYLCTHRIYLNNAVTSGYPSGGAWCDSTVDLMCEEMVYGSGIFHPVSTGSVVPSNYRVEKSQLPGFALNPRYITNRATWWLRDVVSSAYFAFVSGYGVASCNYASAVSGVRPAFCIS